MENKEDKKEFQCTDNEGNLMSLSIEPQEKYPNRYDLKYIFNGKVFQLQHFPSFRDASNMWELLSLLPKKNNKKEK